MIQLTNEEMMTIRGGGTDSTEGDKRKPRPGSGGINATFVFSLFIPSLSK